MVIFNVAAQSQLIKQLSMGHLNLLLLGLAAHEEGGEAWEEPAAAAGAWISL